MVLYPVAGGGNVAAGFRTLGNRHLSACIKRRAGVVEYLVLTYMRDISGFDGGGERGKEHK